MSLVVESLSHWYGDVPALRGVSAAAAAGSITAVLGPNAAGKSTLLRCAIGAIRPTAGAVLIDGQPAHRLSARRLAACCAYVPQRSIVSAAFTVRQVVEIGRYALAPGRAHAARRGRRVDEALGQMELEDLADRPYAALSVGQQQRVTLARALAQMEPEGHLILDEPTSAMDPRHARHAMRLLRRCTRNGATVLLVVHDLSLAAAWADEAWLLREGRLVRSGKVDEVLEPDLLREVYEVEFRWVDDGCGGRVLGQPPSCHCALP